MSAAELHIEYRRRLPIAPNSNLKGVSEVRSRARSLPVPVEFTRSQTMDVRPKKRLTPEVVATLLSMDLGSEGNSLATYQKKGLSDVTSRKSDENPARGTRMSSSKRPTSRDNICIVEIVKSLRQPLGFSLRECNDSHFENPGGIFVSRLTAGGVVEQNSLLHAGDEILEINCVTVHGYKLSDVVAMIQLPRRLALKVRFRGNRHQNKAGTQREFAEKPTLGNNNNHVYDADKTGQNRGADNNSTHEFREGGPNLAQRQMRTYGQTRTCTDGVPAPNALNVLRTSDISLRSPGRILPAPPESEPNKPRNSPRFEDSSTLTSPKPHLSKMSTEVLRAEAVSQANLNPNVMSLNQKGESTSASRTKHKNRRRSAVRPVSDGKSPNSQLQGNPDHCLETGEVAAAKRIDPGDIKFDIVSSPNGADFGPGVISRTSEVQGGRLNRDCTSTSSPVTSRSLNTDSTLRTFDSSSSLSSSDSPKSQYRGPFLGKPRAGDTAPRLSHSELSAHSSCPSIDASPVSSSAETEEQISKSKNTCSDQNKQQKRPLLLHSLSSDELNQSHNSWFAKIGHQTRKQVRKFSEGTQLRAPKGGDVYRVPELTDVPNDDVDPGYRPYPGGSAQCGRSRKKSNARAVTGMLVLHIVKLGSRISPGEPASKDKRKKIKLFCTVDSDGIRQASTCSKKGVNNFQWNESFEIMFQRTREINLTVYTRSKKDGDQTLSQGCLCLSQLLSEGGEHMLAVNLDPVGTLYVRLQFTDMKLLLQRTPSQKKEGVFGFSLEAVLRRESSRIPAIVRKCVEEINRRGLGVTGIYRLCGNAAKKRTLRAEFENNSANVVLDQNENLVDVNVITGLLKDYLRELPNPLLSKDVREILCAALATETNGSSSTTERFLINKITNTFANTSRDTIIYLLDHFETVLMNSDVNKMDSHNLAVCIGPVLLCPSLGATSIDTLSDTKKDISAIKLLLEIWPKPEQISAC